MMSEYVCMYRGRSFLRGDLWQGVVGLVEITFMLQTNWGMPWEGLKAKQIQIYHSVPPTATVHGADGDLQMHPMMHRVAKAIF